MCASTMRICESIRKNENRTGESMSVKLGGMRVSDGNFSEMHQSETDHCLFGFVPPPCGAFVNELIDDAVNHLVLRQDVSSQLTAECKGGTIRTSRRLTSVLP